MPPEWATSTRIETRSRRPTPPEPISATGQRSRSRNTRAGSGLSPSSPTTTTRRADSRACEGAKQASGCGCWGGHDAPAVGDCRPCGPALIREWGQLSGQRLRSRCRRPGLRASAGSRPSTDSCRHGKPWIEQQHGGGGGGGANFAPACTEQPLSPQPAASSPWWDGQTVAEGQVVSWVCSDGSTPVVVVPHFAASGAAAAPGAPPAPPPPPDPAVLAQQAYQQIPIPKPDIHLGAARLERG